MKSVIISFVKNVFSSKKKGRDIQHVLDNAFTKAEVLRKKDIEDEKIFIEHAQNTGVQVSPWGLTLS